VTELSNEHTERAKRFHSTVWQAIEDEVSGPAVRALFAAIYHHRPDEPPSVVSDKPLFPGWRPACSADGRPYPCGEMRDIAAEFDVYFDGG
jgi:hypothetical protein